MSFHTRKINRERILSTYNYNGIKGVIDLFSNPDALTLYDEESSLIYSVIASQKELHEKEEEILKYINKIEIL